MVRPLSSEYSVDLGFSFPKRLGKNLEIWRNAVLNQDTDFACIVDGAEGSSKSHNALKIGLFLDVDTWEETSETAPITGLPVRRPLTRKIDLDTQIVFTVDEFYTAVRTLPPYKAIIFDEAGRSTDRRKSADNVDFNQMLREARQYNKFLIFVVQSFYDMDMFAAVWRTRCLIHFEYTWDLSTPMTPIRRGTFRFYNERGKQELYTNKLMRQKYKYPYVKNECFDASFGYHWIVDHEAYKKKKAEAETTRTSKYQDLKCPECGMKNLRYVRTKNTWTCRQCPFEGGERALGITNNENEKKLKRTS